MSTTNGPPMGFEPMTPAVDAIHGFEMSKSIFTFHWHEGSATIDGTERMLVVIQFNELL